MINLHGDGRKAAPLLRWAGGKRRLMEVIRFALPGDMHPGTSARLVEPFVGGGSFFFWLDPPTALLADANADLVNLYRVVAENPSCLLAALEQLCAATDEDSYYSVREHFWPLSTSDIPDVEHAAKFIYLNKLCFNGLYRVNSKGKFNVPYGHKEKARSAIYSAESIAAASKTLNRAEIRAADFRQTLRRVGPGDFVYLDPPYLPAQGSSEFNAYTRDGFGGRDHLDLIEAMSQMADAGARVLMSNSWHPELIHKVQEAKLYYIEVQALRSIASRLDRRGVVREMLVATYPLSR